MAQQNSPETAKILALEAKWTDAYKARSINTLTSLLAEEFVITVEDGRVFGKIILGCTSSPPMGKPGQARTGSGHQASCLDPHAPC